MNENANDYVYMPDPKKRAAATITYRQYDQHNNSGIDDLHVTNEVRRGGWPTISDALAALSAGGSDPTGSQVDAKPAAHSDDFRSVKWFGTSYTFTANQAKCIKLLWQAWETGTPDRGASILEQAEITQCRVVDVFKLNGTMHPAWGSMIVKGETKGAYRLAPPPNTRETV